MYGRVYTVEFENVAVTTAGGDADLFEISAADDKPCIVHAVFLAVTSELGDAQEEWLRLRVIRGHTTTGNGTSATPRPVLASSPAASFAAKTYGATVASSGTPVNLHSDAFNVRAGYTLILPPEMRWVVTQADGLLVVRLMAGPADDLTMNGTIYVEEL